MKYQLKNENVKFDLDDPVNSLLQINGIQNVNDYIDAGAKDWDEVFNKLSPMYYFTYKPIAEEIMEDIDNHKKFGILVDCDVDGYISGALLYRALRADPDCGGISVFLHSGKEHGLADKEVFNEIKQSNIDVLLVPDAGTGDCEEVAELSKQNIKTFIFDHHDFSFDYQSPGKIINPFLFTNTNEYRDLSGGAVVYTFLHYMKKPVMEENEMVAMSLISDSMDCMSMHNRYILDLGFDHHPVHPLFRNMIDSDTYNIINNLDPVYCSFNIIPKMNALIRMGTQDEKMLLFKALCSETEYFEYTKRDKSVIQESIYDRVNRIGKNAQARQRKIVTSDAERMSDYIITHSLDTNKIIIVSDADCELNSFTKGIAATKISAHFNRPVIVGHEHNGVFSGSIRNNCDYISDFKKMLEDSTLCEVAGHSNAAGIKFSMDNKKNLVTFFNDTCGSDKYAKVYYVDAIFNSEDISDYLASQIDSFKKYQASGIGEARFAIRHVPFDSDIVEIMKNEKHCKWVNHDISYIAFNFQNTPIDHMINDWYNGFITVIGSISLNSYDGIFMPQVKIEDAQIE